MAKIPGNVQEWILGFVRGLSEHEEDVLNKRANVQLEPLLDDLGQLSEYSPSTLRLVADTLGLLQALGRVVPELTVAQFKSAVQSLIHDLNTDITDDEHDLLTGDLDLAEEEVIKQDVAQGKEDFAVLEHVLSKFELACFSDDLTD